MRQGRPGEAASASSAAPVEAQAAVGRTLDGGGHPLQRRPHADGKQHKVSMHSAPVAQREQQRAVGQGGAAAAPAVAAAAARRRQLNSFDLAAILEINSAQLAARGARCCARRRQLRRPAGAHSVAQHGAPSGRRPHRWLRLLLLLLRCLLLLLRRVPRLPAWRRCARCRSGRGLPLSLQLF